MFCVAGFLFSTFEKYQGALTGLADYAIVLISGLVRLLAFRVAYIVQTGRGLVFARMYKFCRILRVCGCGAGLVVIHRDAPSSGLHKKR